MVWCNSHMEKGKVERLNLFIGDRAVFGDEGYVHQWHVVKDQGWTEVMACQEKKWWEWRQISSWFG